MAVVEELIRTENNDTLSFGNYKLDSKSKLDNFAFGGDLYKVKTFKEITKLERNGMFVYESVPGTTVNQLMVTDSGIAFLVEGPKDAQITLELEEQTEYKVMVDNVDAGQMKTNLGGKLSLSVELNEDTPVSVKIEKIGQCNIFQYYLDFICRINFHFARQIFDGIAVATSRKSNTADENLGNYKVEIIWRGYTRKVKDRKTMRNTFCEFLTFAGSAKLECKHSSLAYAFRANKTAAELRDSSAAVFELGK